MKNSSSTNVNLVLLFKSPNNSKRRLAKQIGNLATTAASLLLECALQDVSDWQGPSWFSPASPADQAWLNCRLGGSARIVSQKAGNLGERINQVDQTLRSQGIKKIMYIGADCPGLNLVYLNDAAAQLEKHDVVLGPSLDGGVVLMGSRHAWPALGDLRWSTNRLRDDLAKICKEYGWTPTHLQPLYDIDSASDLLTALTDLASTERSTRSDLANWISKNIDIIQDKIRLRV